MKISYRFAHEQQDLPEFEIDLDALPKPRSGRGEWTRLDRNQCSNCPLQSSEVEFCPTAVDLEDVVDSFNEIISHDRVLVTVAANDRYVIKDCDAQDALSPLIGLIMSTSACPILGRLRGMARTHLPFQSMEETLFRFVGSYFLSQLVQQQQGSPADWSLNGLNAVFDELMLVNQAFKSRVHAASKQDATMNAISALAMQTLGAQLSLDDWYEELAGFAISPPE
ncbi:MAG: DUF6901 family protein [Oceanococcus sp.]